MTTSGTPWMVAALLGLRFLLRNAVARPRMTARTSDLMAQTLKAGRAQADLAPLLDAVVVEPGEAARRATTNSAQPSQIGMLALSML